MSKILAFAGSNSSTSINHELVTYIVSTIHNVSIELFKLSDMDLILYSEDEEKENGFPSSISLLYKHIQAAEGLIISVNEHNSNPSAFFKNVIDWLSRLDKNFLENKKVFLLSASPGGRGGLGSLEVVKALVVRFGGELITFQTFPSFNENFKEAKISNDTLNNEIQEKLKLFLVSIS